jgi:uncharacterized protein Usg
MLCRLLTFPPRQYHCHLSLTPADFVRNSANRVGASCERGELMTDRAFLAQMAGYGLSTVEIHYYMPDHRSLLQQFVIQQYDVAPQFPELDRFLAFWRREIDAVLHSVRVAHKHLIGPQEWRAVDGVVTIN